MPEWTADALGEIDASEEVRLSLRRPDGSPRPPVTIWIVRSATRVFVRSTKGTSGAWFRAALVRGEGRIDTGREMYDVAFTRVDDELSLAAADSAYRAKYGHYVDIVDHLDDLDPRAATLEVFPH